MRIVDIQVGETSITIEGRAAKHWTKSLALFPLGVWGQDFTATEADLKAALLKPPRSPIEIRLTRQPEDVNQVARAISDYAFALLTLYFRRQIIRWYLGRMLVEVKPGDAVRFLDEARVETPQLQSVLRDMAAAYSDEGVTGFPELFRLLADLGEWNQFLDTWNTGVLEATISAYQHHDPDRAREMITDYGAQTKEQLGEEFNSLIDELGIWGLLSQRQQNLGFSEAARVSILWGLEERPDNHHLMFEMGKFHYEANERHAALEWLEKAQDGPFDISLEAFVLRLQILQDQKQHSQIISEIDAQNLWPKQWAERGEDPWDIDVALPYEAEPLRRKIAQILGFAEAMAGIPSVPYEFPEHHLVDIKSSIADLLESIQEEGRLTRADVKQAVTVSVGALEPKLDSLSSQLATLRKESNWSDIKKLVRKSSSDVLQEQWPSLESSLKLMLDDLWDRLSPTLRNDLITAEFLFQAYADTAGFSPRGVVLGFFAPVEGLIKETTSRIRESVPNARLYKLVVDNEGGARRLTDVRSLKHLFFLLADLTSARPKNKALGPIDSRIRNGIGNSFTEEDVQHGERIQNLRNKIHEVEVAGKEADELRRLVLGPNSMLRVLDAIIRQLPRTNRGR